LPQQPTQRTPASYTRPSDEVGVSKCFFLQKQQWFTMPDANLARAHPKNVMNVVENKPMTQPATINFQD